MADNEESEDAVEEPVQDRPAFSWPGRRRADQAAEAADRAALEGLERLRGKSSAKQHDANDPAAPGIGDDEHLRDLIFGATRELRDAIRIEAHEIGKVLRAEREAVDRAIESLQERITELEAGAPTERQSASGTEHLPPREEVTADLNTASQADLCAVGMSQTQASRVIRHRDFWGEFHDVSELDHVPGFTPETRAELDQRLSVGGDEEPTA